MSKFLPSNIVDKVINFETRVCWPNPDGALVVVGVTNAPVSLIMNYSVQGLSEREFRAIEKSSLSLGFYATADLCWFFLGIGSIMGGDAPFGRIAQPSTGDLAAEAHRLEKIEIIFNESGVPFGAREIPVPHDWRLALSQTLSKLPVYESWEQINLAARRGMETLSILQVKSLTRKNRIFSCSGSRMRQSGTQTIFFPPHRHHRTR